MRMTNKRLTSSVWAAGVWAAGLLALTASGASAQTAPATQTAPAGAWNSTVTKSDAPGGATTLDEKQVAALRRVSVYFNELKLLRGNFAQTGPDGKKMRGKFTLKQPGKFRFDYGFGSKQIVMSDGVNLAIQDDDLKNDDRYQLDQTPFRILLRADVDLMRDARIGEVQEVDDLVIVSLADKSPDVPGRIRLFFTKKPNLELKEWVTTDAQGGDTRMELGDLNRQGEIDDGHFKIQAIGLKKIQ